MEREVYAPPNSELENELSGKTKTYGWWQRFYITFLWGFPVFMGFVILGTAKETWIYGAIGSAMFSIGAGIVAMLIPVQRKSVFVTVAVFLGLVTAYIIGTNAG
jgi:4-hydroxybenzoate polyprenyltransferase